MREFTPREFCVDCYKAMTSCICGDIQSVYHKTPITIIQHNRERTHPLGTVRIAKLALENVRVETFAPKEWRAARHAEDILRAIQEQGNGKRTALLYPGPDARLLSELEGDERPEHLVVLDGTWHHAKKLYCALGFLADLPKVLLAPEKPSEYRIRKEPSPESVSTIEAIYYALRELEPENTHLESLLEPFRALIDRQINQREGRQSIRRRVMKQKPDGLGWVPKALVDSYKDLVVCHLEYINEYLDSGKRCEVVVLLAIRPATGESFARYVTPYQNQLKDHHLERFELPLEIFNEASSRPESLRAWEQFLGPNAVPAIWSQNALDILHNLIPNPSNKTRDYLLLKGLYANATRTKPGHLLEAVQRHNLEVEDIGLSGRAARLLGNALAIVQFLRSLYFELRSID